MAAVPCSVARGLNTKAPEKPVCQADRGFVDLTEKPVVAGENLFLRSGLLVNITPRADFQTPAHPAKIFLLLRSAHRRVG